MVSLTHSKDMTSDGASILFSVKLFPNLPAWAARRQAYVLPMFLVYFFFILNHFVRPVISTFTGQIFTKLSELVEQWL